MFTFTLLLRCVFLGLISGAVAEFTLQLVKPLTHDPGHPGPVADTKYQLTHGQWDILQSDAKKVDAMLKKVIRFQQDANLQKTYTKYVESIFGDRSGIQKHVEVGLQKLADAVTKVSEVKDDNAQTGSMFHVLSSYRSSIVTGRKVNDLIFLASDHYFAAAELHRVRTLIHEAAHIHLDASDFYVIQGAQGHMLPLDEITTIETSKDGRADVYHTKRVLPSPGINGVETQVQRMTYGVEVVSDNVQRPSRRKSYPKNPNEVDVTWKQLARRTEDMHLNADAFAIFIIMASTNYV